MKKPYTQKEKDLLLKLLKLSKETSELIIGLGYTDETSHCHTGLVIYKCAPKIINELSKDDEVMLGVENGKVYIEIFPKEKKNNMIPDFDPNRQIAIIWSIEDVQHVRPQLNDKQAMDVLDRIKRHHDCNLGVTWETLRIVAADIDIKDEDIDAYPCHINCNSCGYKQYDEETIKSHCDKTGEDDEIGSYICGACLDTNSHRIRIDKFSREDLDLFQEVFHAYIVEDVLSKYSCDEETANTVAERTKRLLDSSSQYSDEYWDCLDFAAEEAKLQEKQG